VRLEHHAVVLAPERLPSEVGDGHTKLIRAIEGQKTINRTKARADRCLRWRRW
jgi:hypothetical protein